MDSKNLSFALTDVRTAYRLLHQYQRRILDLTKELASRIDGEAQFRIWKPSLYNVPSGYRHNPADHWAWDGLPFYDFCTFYARHQFWKDEHEPGDWMLVLRVSADTSYPFDETAIGGREPDSSRFSPTVVPESILSVYAYQYTQGMTEGWVQTAYGDNDWPDDQVSTRFSDHLSAFGVKEPLETLSSLDQVDAFGRRAKESIERWRVTLDSAEHADPGFRALQNA